MDKERESEMKRNKIEEKKETKRDRWGEMEKMRWRGER